MERQFGLVDGVGEILVSECLGADKQLSWVHYKDGFDWVYAMKHTLVSNS